MTTNTKQAGGEEAIQRKELDGQFQYKSVVWRDGKQIGGEFSDWFADDAAAEAGLRAILTEQGYEVESVTIGEVTVVVLKGGAQ